MKKHLSKHSRKQNQWVIVGASSTIAKHFARLAANYGDDIILVGRHESDLKSMAADLTIRYDIACQIYILDINNVSQYQGLWDLAETSQKRTNIFLAAGIMMDETDLKIQDVNKILQTNLVSPILFLQQWIEFFKSSMGSIVVLGSVAGDRGRAKNMIYGATKGGLSVYLDGLRIRLLQKNISVLLVKPGPIDTQMTFHLNYPLPFLASPEKCAKACWKGYIKRKHTIYYPSIWRYIMLIIRNLPFFIFQQIKS